MMTLGLSPAVPSPLLFDYKRTIMLRKMGPRCVQPPAPGEPSACIFNDPRTTIQPQANEYNSEPKKTSWCFWVAFLQEIRSGVTWVTYQHKKNRGIPMRGLCVCCKGCCGPPRIMKAGHGMRSTELHYHFAGVNFPEMSWLGPVRSGLSLIAVLDIYIYIFIYRQFCR